MLPGVQVLFAFLLAVPFSTRFDRVDRFERVVFFIALLFAALSVVLLLAPSIQHRILFRHDQKRYLVHVGDDPDDRRDDGARARDDALASCWSRTSSTASGRRVMRRRRRASSRSAIDLVRAPDRAPPGRRAGARRSR